MADDLNSIAEKAVQAVEAAMRAAWFAGVERGVQQERDRVMKMIQGDAPAPKEAPAPAVVAAPAPLSATVPLTTAEYGRISRPVREALRDFGKEKGLDIQEITDIVNRNRVDQISLAQVRTSLKVLARRGEAVRTERGRYRPQSLPLTPPEKNEALPEPTESAPQVTGEAPTSPIESGSDVFR